MVQRQAAGAGTSRTRGGIPMKQVVSIVVALIMFAALASCAPSFDRAMPMPASVVGKWIYRDYDPKTKTDKPGGYTTTYEIFKDGTAKATDGGTGHVISYTDNEIKLEATNGAYKMTITWDPRTSIGQILFSDAPGDSPKKNAKGPYDISMRIN
jgi:hypothetical protein